MSDPNVGIGKQRPRDIKIVFGQFRRPASGAAGAPSSGKAGLGMFPDTATRS